MRFLFLSNLYPPHDLGGYEQWCQEMALALGRRGHTIHVLTSRYGAGASDNAIEENVTRSLFLQTGLHRYHIGRDFIGRTGKERWNEQELRRIFQETNPDLTVVWGMWNLSPLLPYYLEQWAAGRLAYYLASYWPIDTEMHQAYWQRPGQGAAVRLAKRLGRRYAAWQFRREGYPPHLRLEQTASCSRYVRDTLVQAGCVPADAGVIYGGIDPEPFFGQPPRPHFENGAVRLLYFGSLLPQKGVRTAVEALGCLRQQGEADGVTLTILGGGHPDYEAELRTVAVQQQVADRITFAGRINRSQIPAWLPNYDVFLFTSTWPEPFGRTIVEAMAAGLVVIGSSVGGSREIFEHYAPDLLFQPGDAATLAAHISRLRDNPPRQRELLQRGRQVICSHFTLDRMAAELEQWFIELTP